MSDMDLNRERVRRAFLQGLVQRRRE